MHAADHLPHLRELSAGTAHAGLLTAERDTLTERTEQLGVGFLDGDVVHQRDGTGTNAEDVVDVHRDAVDPHAVELAGGLRNQKLRADAVRRDGDPESVAHRDHVREVADVEDGARSGREIERRTDPAKQRAETATDRPDPDRVLGQRRHRSDSFRPVDRGTARYRAAWIVDSPGAPTARAREYRRTNGDRKAGGGRPAPHLECPWPATRCASVQQRDR